MGTRRLTCGTAPANQAFAQFKPKREDLTRPDLGVYPYFSLVSMPVWAAGHRAAMTFGYIAARTMAAGGDGPGDNP